MSDFDRLGGGDAPLTSEDLKGLKAGRMRVLSLMKDGAWYLAHEIRKAAGSGGVPASEGLRRMRELRDFGYDVEKLRDEGRVWRYRLIASRAPEDDKYLEEVDLELVDV